MQIYLNNTAPIWWPHQQWDSQQIHRKADCQKVSFGACINTADSQIYDIQPWRKHLMADCSPAAVMCMYDCMLPLAYLSYPLTSSVPSTVPWSMVPWSLGLTKNLVLVCSADIGACMITSSRTDLFWCAFVYQMHVPRFGMHPYFQMQA